MASNRQGAWRIAVAVAAAGAVLASLLLSHAFDYLTNRLLLATLLVQPLNILSGYFVAARLGYLAGPKVSTWSAAKAQCLAALILHLLPSRLSEVVKPLYLADRCNIAISRVFAAVVCERLSDLLIMAVAVTASVAYLASDSLHSSSPYWIGSAAAVVAFSIVLILRPQLFEQLIALLPWTRLSHLMNRLLTEAASILKPRNIPAILALGSLGWICSYLMTFAFLVLASSKPIGPNDALIVFLAGTAGFVVGVAPGGIGTFEGAIVVALGLYGYSVGEALALAVGMRIATMALPGAIAVVVLARERTGLRSFLRRIRGLLQKTTLAQDGSAEGGG